MKTKLCYLFLVVILFCLTLTGCDIHPDNTVPAIDTNPANTNGEIEAYKGTQLNDELSFANAINIDNEYYFYYFYLGTISSVPINTSVALQYKFDTEVVFSFNQLTSETLTNSISKSTEVIDTYSYTGGFSIGYQQEASAEVGVEFAKVKATFTSEQETDHHWTNNWGSTATDSVATTKSYLTQYSNGYSEKVAFSEQAGFTKNSYYRMAFYDTVCAYGVLVYDVKNNMYSAVNDFLLKPNATVRVWEESPNGDFTYRDHKDLVFDVNKAILYAETHKLGSTQGSSDEERTLFHGGNGTVATPYIISDKQHFKNMIIYPTKFFKLNNSINLGVWNSPFEFFGNLDGNGYEVKYSQTIGADTDCGGLFSVLNGATVSGLKINATISSPNKDGALYVGALAGMTKDLVTISKVTTSGAITIKDGIGVDFIGGIVGQFLGGEIDQCKNAIDIEDHAFTSRTGGIVGYATPSEISIIISNCYNVGSLKACTAYVYGGRSAGGIVGQVRGHDAFRLNISCCYNNGDVKIIQIKNAALGWWGCGGLFGDIDNKISNNISVSNSFWNKNKTSLSGNSSNYHKNNSKTNMNGAYTGWSTNIWKFSSSKAPELIWLEIN